METTVKQPYTFTTDDGLCITSWEAKLSELTGKDSSETLGKKYYDVLPKILVDDRDAVEAVLGGSGVLNLKSHCINWFGRWVKADITLSPIKGDNGMTRGTEVTISAESACPLEKELQNSQRLIDIGKMATTLAHGVRNPLNAIKGAVIYLGEKYAEEETLSEFTKIIEEEISRLDNFISRFLSASAAETEFAETDINALVKKTEIVISLQAHAFNISTVYNYGDIPRVVTNYFQLEQAILNVLNNAIEAMRSGGKLTVATSVQEKAGRDFVVIEISDTGPGMSGNKVSDLSAPSKSNGKGYGLFITREILQFLRGHTEIKSGGSLGGTTVRLFIPVA